MEIFEHQYPVPETYSLRLQIAWRQIEFATRYTRIMLEDLTDDDWFWSPQSLTTSMSTHIGWQVGHIAISIYGLTLFRQRGRAEIDSELMSGKFRKRFMKGTEPTPNRDDYPDPQEILAVLDRVEEQMRIELPSFDGDPLDEVSDPPHAVFGNRYGALLFAGEHTMLHAGQIGMLRRLMGKPPLR
jgi:hypothetical protein